MSERPIFYYDLGSPYAYLAAERINSLFAQATGEPPVWQPVLLGGLFKRFGRSSWGTGGSREVGIAEVERRAAAYGLPPIRWPDPWPGNMLTAMRAAVYAKSIGKAVSFSLAGFRQAFAGGLDLTEPDNVCIAAAACEIHPRALLKAVARDSVKQELIDATEAAADAGVTGVPSVVVDGEVFWGDDQLETAVAMAAGS